MPNPGTPNDPYPSFRFSLEIAGVVEAQFTECSGLSATTKITPYEEGGLNNYTHQIIGRTSYANITLKRGIAESSELWDWYHHVLQDHDKSAQVKDISVIHYNSTGDVVYRWNLLKAFPVKWTGPSFDAGNSQIGVETFEITFADIVMLKE
jgi:phage tail-like protein